MKKRMIVFGVVIIALISLLPFPQKIERTFYGLNTFNGEKANITLNMKYFRFLFLKDKMYGEIAVTSENETTIYGDSMDYVGLLPLNNADQTVHAFIGWYFNSDIIMHDYGDGMLGTKVIGYELASAYISRDFNKIVLYHKPSEGAEDTKPKQYIGNVAENKEQETIQYFETYIQS